MTQRCLPYSFWTLKAGSEVDEPPGELPHYDPEGPHSSDLEDSKIHHLNCKAVCCTSTSVEDIGRMIESVTRVFRQEVGRPQGDERTRNPAHVILQLISCLWVEGTGRCWFCWHDWYGGFRW